MTQRGETPPLWKQFGLYVTLGVILYVIVGGVALVTVPDQLLANWFPDLSSKERAAFLGPATNAVLFALGGTIALVGVGLSLSRHRQELEAAARDRVRLRNDQEREQSRRQEAEIQRRTETERALRDRFVTTVNLLSDPSPVNRQAAIFALGALADDWTAFGKRDEVQVCIEVLTGYLRAPRSDDMLLPLTEEEHAQLDPTERREAQRTTPQEIAVKQAGYSVIKDHLKTENPSNWCDRPLNLDGSHIDFMVNLRDCDIDEGAYFDLHNATISNDGILAFRDMTVSGFVDLENLKIVGGYVELRDLEVKDGAVVTISGTTVCADGHVSLEGATISAHGTLAYGVMTLKTGGSVNTPDGILHEEPGV
ncbi:hypothetical protein KXS11_18005 [Plantibacter flavus]|uniref:hypothetical protein n=1 Tax=Plantibacter flavus TaxID=150123 RepID=UPI003F1586D7